MPQLFSDSEYGQAVFGSVQNGAYPESEELISAEFPPSALPGVIKLLEKAREDVKANVKGLSKESAPDIDGWISQAKQLRDDIEDSKEQSRAIVIQAEVGQKLLDKLSDAASKVRLLQNEVVFNKSLATTMQRILAVRRTLDHIQDEILGKRMLDAAGWLDHGDAELSSLQDCENSRIASIIRTRMADLRQDVVADTRKYWNNLVCANAVTSTVTVKQQLEGSYPIDINTVTHVLVQLQALEPSIRTLCQDINKTILLPRLERRLGGSLRAIYIDGNEMRTSQEPPNTSLQTLFSDIRSVIEFLRAWLPPAATAPLSGLLMPKLVSRIISTWLSSAVPIELDGMDRFQGTVEMVFQFAEDLDSCQWPGKEYLVAWAKAIPRLWLEKRREASLDSIRKVLQQGLGKVKTVERIETQMLSREDDVLAVGGGKNDWNAEWSDEEGRDPPKPTGKHAVDDGDEEDVSAWGLDEDTHDGDAQEAPKHTGGADDDDADAWGWGDDADIDETSKHSESIPKSPGKSRPNGHPEVSAPSEREITLKETYNITSLPSEVLEIISRLISDAEALAEPMYSKLPIAAAAAGLNLVPGLVLSMYRASAPNYYARDINGSMFLYNDSIWIAERLRQIAEGHSKQLGRPRLEADVEALEHFGKRAYGKEMESQRTIIGDLLDGAQGFSNCTEPPFAQECDLAISSVVDRLRYVHKQWRSVLSRSALLQSLGSLLSTVVNKIIVDICDMSDISEPESQRLTAFCNRIAALEDLFTPESTHGAPFDMESAVPLTAIYAPNWLKFQYLSQILDSTLVDIKYLWTEGELRLEFTADELADLIQALFADSEHRRRAIAEIRRS